MKQGSDGKFIFYCETRDKARADLKKTKKLEKIDLFSKEGHCPLA